ncbi:uncharacterized protein V1510DRAFT_394416 [Dipodascopsis tothii]|uniref:uncharacterized protein n=1 Tax=Dipodascopsis tothii TaxID=44089 RepID=UPI0034CF14A8
MLCIDTDERVLYATSSVRAILARGGLGLVGRTLAEIGLVIEPGVGRLGADPTVFLSIPVGKMRLYDVALRADYPSGRVEWDRQWHYQFEVRAFLHFDRPLFHIDVTRKTVCVDRLMSREHIAVSTRYRHKNVVMAKLRQQVLDAMEVPLLISSCDGTVTAYNKAMESIIMPDTHSKPVPFDWLRNVDCYTPDYTRRLDRSEMLFEKLCQEGKPYKLSLGQVIDGRQRFFYAHGEPLFEEREGARELLGGMLYIKDFTDWNDQVMGAASKNERLFSQICDAMPSMVWVSDAAGHNEYFSAKWTDFTGKSPSYLLSAWPSVVHPTDFIELRARWEHSLATGQPFSVEHRFLRKDGKWVWVVNRALPMRDDAGKILKWVGTVSDIQRRIEASIEVCNLWEQLRCLVTNSETTIWSVDQAGQVTMFEGAADSPLSELLASGVDIATAMAPYPNFCQPLQSILHGERTSATSELTVAGAWLRTRYLPMYATTMADRKMKVDQNKIVGVIGVSQDVTKRRQTNIALEARTQECNFLAERELAAQEDNRKKTQFLANMVHEIRTPLAGIAGMADLLDDVAADGEQKEYVAAIQTAVKGLLGIVKDVIDFSKLESGRMEVEAVPFNLSELVRGLCGVVASEARQKALDFVQDVRLGADDKLVKGDLTKIREALLNILYNALKFTEEGHIRFTVRLEDADDDGDWVYFMIADTGIGMSPEVMSSLFKAYTQGDMSNSRGYGGTGLGLSICKSFVELMGGQIGASSAVQKGIEIWFRVKLGRPTAEERQHLRALSVGVRLLLVEDNLVNQKIAQKALAKLGYSVDTALNGIECLTYVQQHGPPDLILMDCQMPLLDGYATSCMLRAHPEEHVRTTPIVAVTANAIDGDRERCLRAGMSDYVPKPYKADDLDRVIGKWLFRRRSSSSITTTSDPPALPPAPVKSAVRWDDGPIELDPSFDSDVFYFRAV